MICLCWIVSIRELVYLQFLVTCLPSLQDELSYVLWTGDTAPHDSWKTSRKEVLDLTARVTAQLRHKLAGVPVYPLIGNHDSAPTN